MKYTIFINQKAIVDAGLHESTDLVDWAILEYIQTFLTNPRATIKDGHVWINYGHLIDEMPLLGLGTKQAVSKRIIKLRDLGLVDTIQDIDKRLYAKPAAIYHEITQFSCQQNSDAVNHSGHGVNHSGQGVNHSGQGVNHSGQGVNHGGHSYKHQNISSDTSSLPPLEGEMKNCFDWATTQPFWKKSITSVDKFLQLYAKQTPNGLRAQYEQAVINHNNRINQQPSGVSGNATHHQSNTYTPKRKLTPAERIAVAAGYTIN